ncbi:DUF4429 domain-containing protein [Streptomyces sp. NPDC101150]|uniref:DUF4429 domain-containing protein n=1 Tax=Streptomyces sp. NPDC101150 TaxID=3366114 RepID=UPI0038199B06
MGSLRSAGGLEDGRAPDPPTRLTGERARLDFDGRRCVIRYPGRGARTLLRALDGRTIPVRALSAAVLSPPGNHARWGTLRLVPHPGADAVAEVLGAQLPEPDDPYLIRFHRRELRRAEHLHRLLAQAIDESGPPDGSGPPLPVPSAPRVLRGILSQAEFDGHVIRLTGGGHHSADGSARVIPLAALDGVTYIHGHSPALRLHLPDARPSYPGPADDPDTLVLNGLREGANVLFAARLLEAHTAAAAARARVTIRTERTDGPGSFTARAELAGEAAGSVRLCTPPDAPQVREIAHLQVERSVGTDAARAVADALVHAALRWGYASGATYLTGPGTAGSGGPELCRRHGFSDKALTGTAGGAPRPCLVLGRYAADREHDVFAMLDDVAPRRRTAAGCGSWALGFLLFFALLFVGGAYRLAAGPRLAGVPLGFLAVGSLIALVVWPRARAALRAVQLKQSRDARATMLADPRPPVLYLRSFRDDRRARKPARPGSLVTEEEAVSTAMAGIGPFIGLDNETETLGAAKARVRDEDWRPAVTALMSCCSLTVMRCGEGESLFWELREARRLLRPEQLVILVPRDQGLYETFRKRAAPLLPHPLPHVPVPRRARQRLVAAIRFSADWRPRIVSLRMPPALRFFSLESCLVFRLLPELRELRHHRLLFWYRRAVFFLFTAAALYLLIGYGLPILDALTRIATPIDVHFPTFPTAPPHTHR